MRHRVVVTGIGLCTPVGNEVESFWQNLTAGRSGIVPISLFDASTLPVRIGGEVRGFDILDWHQEHPQVAEITDRKVLLGLSAVRQAVQDAGLDRDQIANAQLRIGVSLEYFAFDQVAPVARADNLVQALAKQWLSGTRTAKLQTPLDCLAQIIGDYYQISQGCFTNCSACAAGAQVIGEAFHSLRDGEVDLALAGATDSTLNPLGLGGFSLLRILSNENDRPREACRPFDATRQGTVLSEGAAFVVMETLEHAQARKAKIYAEIIGYASSLDAYRVSDPDPTGCGAALCMSRAIQDAGLEPAHIDCVNAHGTGTPKNDVTETLALKQVLGRHAYAIPISAIKSMTGHLIAASGAVEAAASALSLHTGTIPPTINLKIPDPQCDLDYVTEGARPFSGDTILSNSFGFGGQNAALIVRKL